jgi:hypothetical protein
MTRVLDAGQAGTRVTAAFIYNLKESETNKEFSQPRQLK